MRGNRRITGRERGGLFVAAADWGFSRQDKLVPDPQFNKIHP